MDFLSLFDGVDISLSGQHLILNGSKKTKQGFPKYLEDLVTQGEDIELLRAWSGLSPSERKATARDVFDSLKDFGLEEEHKESTEGVHGYMLSLTPIVDHETAVTYMYDEETGNLVDTKPEAWEKTTDPKGRNKPVPVQTVYNPFTLVIEKEKQVAESTGFMIVNRYSISPALQDIYSVKGEVECPEFLERLTSHLLDGNTEQIHFLYDQMYLMLFKRAQQYLCFNGRQGAGKNFIADLIKGMVGSINYASAPKSIFGQFNSVLRDKRIILFDEYRVDPANHRQLKKLANDYQVIEAKGIDANKEERIHCSYIMFHNNLSDLYVESGDRRFAILDMTDKELIKSFSQEELFEYSKQMSNPDSELLRHCALFLLRWGQERTPNPFEKIKTKKFLEAVTVHTPHWLKAVIARAEKGETVIPLKRIKTDLKHVYKPMIPNRVDTVNNRLLNYDYRDGIKLGTANRDGHGGEIEIRISPEMVELFKNDEGEEDFL